MTNQTQVLGVQEVHVTRIHVRVVHDRGTLEQQVLETSISSTGIGKPKLGLQQGLVLLVQSLGGEDDVRLIGTFGNSVVRR